MVQHLARSVRSFGLDQLDWPSHPKGCEREVHPVGEPAAAAHMPLRDSVHLEQKPKHLLELARRGSEDAGPGASWNAPGDHQRMCAPPRLLIGSRLLAPPEICPVVTLQGRLERPLVRRRRQ